MINKAYYLTAVFHRGFLTDTKKVGLPKEYLFKTFFQRLLFGHYSILNLQNLSWNILQICICPSLCNHLEGKNHFYCICDLSLPQMGFHVGNLFKFNKKLYFKNLNQKNICPHKVITFCILLLFLQVILSPSLFLSLK